MSDPIPSATADPESGDQKLPANAEDRKAAAALSALHTNDIAEASPTRAPSSADQEALGKAMSRLESVGGKGAVKKPAAGTQKQEAEKKKVVKIVAADVTFLVEQLEIHKNKATELLRACDGDVVSAMRAYIAPF
ncbi:hypothetical protein N7478_006205 [Penicillium angulare]|uniref:uncharacterized protein n=1 Tax=Penicillium angulare TaxID=116970 RepID=UPI00254144C9|nr:uncharacterized protein N7478_006205 [Penicillium angulare]KAJ5280833.1 hypothetical protein N7478_006205 [Penicillium angulare]